MMTAKQEIVALMRMADEDTRAALVRLAELFDEHVLDCPHIAPPVARDAPTTRPEGYASPAFDRGLAQQMRDFRPTSADEQAQVDRAASVSEGNSSVTSGQRFAVTATQVTEALASARLDRGDGQTLSAEVRDAD